MPSPIDMAWLIPLMPMAGGLLIGILLISFNRTMNRLSKPVAFTLISCASISAIISYLIFSQEMSDEIIKEVSLSWDPSSSNTLHIDLIIDKVVSIILSITSTIIIILMIAYHFLMYRKQRYVLYFIIISLSSSSLLGLSFTQVARELANKIIST